MFDWLYGPRRPDASPAAGIVLRNLTLDIDTLFDLAAEIPNRILASGVLAEKIDYEDGRGVMPLEFETEVVYSLRGRPLSEDEVRALGTPDRNQLHLSVQVNRLADIGADNAWLSIRNAKVELDCPTATIVGTGILGYGQNMDDIVPDAVEYLYANGAVRVDNRALRWMAYLLPVIVGLGAWVWLALSAAVPIALHVLLLALLAFAGVNAYQQARGGIRKMHGTALSRSIRFRGESRKETQQRRVDTHQNIKVAILTAPIAILVGVLATLMTGAGR